MISTHSESQLTLRERAEKIARAKACESSESLSSDQVDALLHELQVHQIELEMQNDELRETMLQLETSRAKYSDLYDFSPVGYVTLNEVGTIVEANLTAATLLGIGRKYLLNKKLNHFIYSEDQDIFYRHCKRIVETGNRQDWELRLTSAAGGLLWVHLQANTVWKGEYRIILSDISAQKVAEEVRLNLERELLYVYKIESLGRMSSGIAHDFNNLLQAILGNLELASMKLPEESNVRKHISQATKAAENAASLSGMMLTYSGNARLVSKALNLNDFIQEHCKFFSIAISNSIILKIRLADALPPVKADIELIQRVLMSLIVNSSEAIGTDSGLITISTGVDEFDQSTLNSSRLEEKLTAGSYVWVEVRDNGCGMDHEILYKLFDPFFSTKFTGRGLSLSATQGIIRAHRGGILVDSKPGSGTAIRVLLPIHIYSQEEIIDSPEMPAEDFDVYPQNA